MLAGHFEIKLLHFAENKKVKKFITWMFQFGLVPTTNKLRTITKVTISAINHIITNSIKNNKFKTAILTADISNHFTIIYGFKLKAKLDIHKTQFLHSRIINENLLKAFKFRLCKLLWEKIIIKKKKPNGSFKKFILILTSFYDKFFPKNCIKVRHR